ncbi:C45 family peptidase [Cryobacterium sp. Y82]|uniref:C45 family autoproteolytic acyltransferase/hydolase n=1 Tax=Cryobacterium sp. Y82 TaxID=2045017 RepID=UPI0018EA94ED|nr:C45 family peptidase [Cryobacterium sp. Y82]
MVVVEGSDHEMGGQIGEATRDLIHRSVETYARRYRNEAKLSDSDIHRWGSTYYKAVEDFDPRISAMLMGVSEGSGIPVETITALNARTELLYGTGYRDEGCTSYAVLPERMGTAHTVIGQNWDWRSEQRDVTFLLATRDTEGFSVLTLTEAGMLAKSGLNSAGIGACANLLVSNRDRSGTGIPYHFLLRSALNADTLSRAIKRVTSATRISSGNIMLGAAGGEAIDLELAPDVFGHVLPERGIITHANHFESKIDVVDRFVSTSALSLIRSPRLRRLFERHGQILKEDQIVAGLRDHFSYPDSICRHPDPLEAEIKHTTTLYSILMDLDERTMAIAPEFACVNPYVRWSLDTIFDAERRSSQQVFEPILEDAHV